MVQPLRAMQQASLIATVALPAQLVLAAWVPVSAQALRGVVLDDQSLAPVAGASIRLLTGDSLAAGITEPILGSATQSVRPAIRDSTIINGETNENGRFLLTVPHAGDYRLEVARLGYRTARSQSFRVEADDTVVVEFRVLPDAVLLDPLTVTGRSNLGRNLFEHRRSEWGRGVFLAPEQIDSIAPRHAADVFDGVEKIYLRWDWGALATGGSGPIPSIRSQLGRGCLTWMVDREMVRPEPWVHDGAWAGHELGGLTAEDVIAVEVYRSISEVPPELRRHTHQSRFVWNEAQPGRPGTVNSLVNCGLAIIWTRAGW